MFVDLVGSTGLVDALDPEDAQDVFDAFTGRCVDLITGHGGYVARIEGDGVLAYFGFPTAREDASEQAVRAGLAVAQAVGRIRTPLGKTLACRTGIPSGSVLVGEAHTSSGSVFHEVIGRCPHVARRLQEQVDPGEVGISDAVYRKTGGFFVCAPNPPIRLKGFRNPEMFWRVREQGALPLRFLARDTPQRAEFVGRTAELTVLHRQWDEAMRGAGHALAVVGPGGIGKSRMIYEFVRATAEDDPHVILMQAQAHHQLSAWQPVREELSRHLDAVTMDGDDRLAALARDISEDADLDDARAVMGILEQSPSGMASARPGEERGRVVSALVRRLHRIAAASPVILVVEDVHWLDESSAEWLDALTASLDAHPILVVMTSRESVADKEGDHLTEMPIAGLAHDDARAMVERLVSESPFAQLSVDDVLGKADGVPLFIEEYVSHRIDRMVTDGRGGGASDMQPDVTPTNLMDLLNERIDELGPGKGFVQACAVCGNAFDLRVVAQAVDIDLDRAISIISELESRGILTGSEAVGDEFRFRHALLRDAGYASLLKADRVSLHARVAVVMEHADPPGAPEVLAWHFAEAHKLEKCLNYRIRAAEKFKGQYASTESLRQLELAAAAVSEIEDPAKRREWLVRIYNELGATRSIFFGWGDQTGQEMFEKALSLTVSSDDRHATFDSVRGLWNVNMIRGNFPMVAILTRQLTAIAGSTDDSLMKVDAANANGAYRLWSGAFADARGHFEDALRLYETLPTDRRMVAGGTDPGVVAMSLNAWNTWFLGRRQEAIDTIEEAKTRARRSHQAFSMAYAHNIAASIWQTEGDPERTRVEAELSVEIASEHRGKLAYWIDRGGFLAGWAICLSGDREAGIARIRDAIESYEASGGRLLLPYARSLLGECLLARGLIEEAEPILEQASETIDPGHTYFYEPERLRLLGEARTRRGAWGDGAAIFNEALTLAERFGSPPLRAAILRSRTTAQEAI
jgi:class 3 adenylate cyclase/tetratricopeptide (TPR) repeat protein